jgi:Ca-activated chloride channel family protein
VLDATRPAVASVWARQRITELSRRLVRAADPAVQQEVLALALEHRLLTPYTAFVAVDESRVTAGGAPRRAVVPVEVPDAVHGIAERTGTGYGYGGYAAGGGSFGYRGVGAGGGGYASFGSAGAISSGFDASVASGTLGGGRIGVAPGPGGFGIRTPPSSPSGPSGPSVGYDAVGGLTVEEINASRTPTTFMRGRRQTRPTFTIPTPTLEGEGLDKLIIRRYVRRKEAQLSYCYEKELLASPRLAGTVRASVTINEGGHAASTASGLGNAAVEACIAEALRSIEFPRPKDGPVRATFSFQLQPPPPETP